jgi:hypothetical protein
MNRQRLFVLALFSDAIFIILPASLFLEFYGIFYY